MNNNNYYQQCAEYLRDAHGIAEGSEVAIKLSRSAFLQGDLSVHYHWKFVLDYLEGLSDEIWKAPQPEAFQSPGVIH